MADSEGSIKIDYSGLDGAATSYRTEEGKFSETTDELRSELNAVISIWKDASNENWKTKVANACDSLAAVNELLSANADALDEAQRLAKASENSVAAGVGNL